MAKHILLDEFHLTVTAPPNLAEAEYLALRRMLDSQRFQAELRRAIGDIFRQRPNLAKVRVRVSR